MIRRAPRSTRPDTLVAAATLFRFWVRCRVSAEQGLSSLSKLSGSQRPLGLIFTDNLKRQIFLGTLELGDEEMALNYGSDRMRDMAGLVERIGDNRWRLVLPAPAYESFLTVIVLVPAGRRADKTGYRCIGFGGRARRGDGQRVG